MDSSIVSLRLIAFPAGAEARQFGLFENTLRDPNQFAETLARLAVLVGAEKMGTPILEGTHRPDAFKMQRPDFDTVSPETSNSETTSIGLQLRRFRPPIPALIEFRDGNPALIRSEIFKGPVTASRGPYFSSGNWWDDDRWARAEWDIETSEGSLLRAFRSSAGCFIEGVYD
ncbi:MAG TPA: hypothetical protein VH280_05175 [Verrucomicrobiae bacterium]|jgi:protein ImuB|nr:hypothetical protein [Verrucomicrobiae bacterium]